MSDAPQEIDRYTLVAAGDHPFPPLPGEMYDEDGGVVEFLCPCGCGEPRRLPVDGRRGWSLSRNGTDPSISPSIRHLQGCRSHYFITDGVVRWCSDSPRPNRKAPHE